MELQISKRDFLRGLARTYGVADRKSSMPILSNVLLRTEGDGALRLATTDLYLGVTAVAPAKVVEPGSIAVAARTLFDIVKNLPEGDVSLEESEHERVEIRCGKVRYAVPSLPGEDFPLLPNPGEAEFARVPAEALGELITLTQYSISSDDTRPHLASALFEGQGEVLRMVTTDGHRLSKAEHTVPNGAFGFSMLVPHKGVGELRRFIDDVKSRAGRTGGDAQDEALEAEPPTVEVAAQSGNAFFRHGDASLSVKLVDEQFPPYAKVIPHSHQRRVVLARERLVEALRRIGLVADPKSGGVQLHFEAGVLRILSQNQDVGEGREELDVDYDGDKLAIGFSVRYLLDVLGALTHDEVALELSGPIDPGAIKPVGEGVEFVGVIMPMRI
ncbi:MAG: DNA polymerase III subunit beta [Myxococcales bacterium]|nr:DNA polymerase III subunit beta [Myxococcales bacterium]